MNLTDNEIIKALECCCGTAHDSCRDCPYDDIGCEDELEKDALNLINRQKAEIEKLTNKLEQREEMMANLGVELTAMRSAANSYKLQYEKTQVVVERLENSLAIAKKELKRYTKSKQEVVNNVIKEFWKKIKKYCKREICFFTPEEESELIQYGDNLVKEMAGD